MIINMKGILFKEFTIPRLSFYNGYRLRLKQPPSLRQWADPRLRRVTLCWGCCRIDRISRKCHACPFCHSSPFCHSRGSGNLKWINSNRDPNIFLRKRLFFNEFLAQGGTGMTICEKGTVILLNIVYSATARTSGRHDKIYINLCATARRDYLLNQ